MNFNDKEPRIISEEYMAQLQHAKAYYFPFGELNFIIKEGRARTWFSEEHKPLQQKDIQKILASE